MRRQNYKQMKIKILLTFDYELPLGELRTDYAQALFNPTDELLNLTEQENVPITLFADILSAYKFKQWDYNDFYLPYVEQIENAIKQNHDVQLHVHPHWLTSSFENGKVVCSTDFSLSDFANNSEYGISEIITLSHKLLSQITQQADTNHKIIAYRAGGYNIEPASDLIFKSLIENGIKYDSSIAPGYYFASQISTVDFRKYPKSQTWLIDESGNFRVNNQSGIREIPIATIPKKLFEVPTALKLKFSKQKGSVHGTMIHQNYSPTLGEKIKMKLANRMLTFDNYTYSDNYNLKILEYQIRKYGKNSEIIISSCSHPKSMNERSFYLMKKFISQIREKYSEAEFTTFKDL